MYLGSPCSTAVQSNSTWLPFGDAFKKYMVLTKKWLKSNMPMCFNWIIVFHRNNFSWSEEQGLICLFPIQIFFCRFWIFYKCTQFNSCTITNSKAWPITRGVILSSANAFYVVLFVLKLLWLPTLTFLILEVQFTHQFSLCHSAVLGYSSTSYSCGGGQRILKKNLHYKYSSIFSVTKCIRKCKPLCILWSISMFKKALCWPRPLEKYADFLSSPL